MLDPVGHVALRLAREAVEGYVLRRAIPEPPSQTPPELIERAGVFVTLRVQRRLRGCIGTLTATRPTIAHEIIANAIASATADPRFPPVTAAELPDLNYEVDILEPLEPVAGAGQLDPAVYGVVVEAGERRGVLLPGLEEVRSVEQQIAIAASKAQIAPDSPVSLYRFRVRRFREEPPTP